MWRSTVPIGGMPRMARLETPRSVRFMFQTILIAHDGPERGGEATALAEALRDPATGTLLLTSVYPPTPPPVGGLVAPQEIEGRRDDTEETLRVARDSMPDKNRVTIRAIPSDSASRALTTVAEAEQADLVVVGSSRQRDALRRLLPASTPEHLLDDAPCPVAVAPRGYSGGDIRRIGVAHDGSHEADAALHAAESLALELPAALTVYCVVESASPSTGAATERVRDLLHGVLETAPRFLNKPGWLLVQGVPAGEIAGRAYGVVDLLFVGSRGYGPVGRALLDNVSAVVREAGCPVVVVPRPPVAARHAADATVMAHA
jgi:nucleotide-binding universal stress UspA family protein